MPSAPPYAPPGEQVSLALLVVLSLTERAVFVLREVFGLPVAEVATALGRTEAAVRQMARRSRAHVQARRPRFDADRQAQREITERFLAACAGGDLGALLTALAPDAVLITDGGGKVKAALRPITGADKVARFVLGIAAQNMELPDLRIEIADVNGSPAVVAWAAEEPLLSVSLVVVDGLVDQVLMVGNPDKLAGLSVGSRG